MVAAALVLALAAALNPIQQENALGGSTQWRVDDVRNAAIEGYTSEISVAPGDTVHFHVQTSPAESYHIVVYRLGWYGGLGARQVACVPEGCPSQSQGHVYDRPGAPWQGAQWPVTDTLTIPQDWVSGYYLARFELRSGDQLGRAASAMFVVRAPPSRRSPILVQVPVNTWEAYNPWGGKSLYDELSDGGRASRVSFERPMPQNAFQTWEWEIQLVHFLEREGDDVSYQTDVDTDRDPASLNAHRLVIVNGHDEYWTSGIRDAFEAARDEGTNLAFFGANIGYWQVRYEDDRHTIVGYKSSADPVTDPKLQTVQFRQLTPPRPECQLLGVQYDETRKASGDPPRDYAINPAALPDPWFANTGFTGSTVLPRLVGPEWDFVQNGCKSGLTVLFHYTGTPGNADAVRYTAPSGARVFSAGSLQFAWGLDDWLPPSQPAPYPAIPGEQQLVRNILADLTRPAAPLSLTGTPTGGGVALRIDRGPDPRITATIVRRDGKPVCQDQVAQCYDGGLAGHRSYSYSAVNVDEWGQSAPLVVSVAVPNHAPQVTLRGPRSVRAGRRVVFTATAFDRDGDPLTYRWRVDGRAAPGRGGRVTLALRAAGRHTVSVEVRDAYGGSARAALAVRAHA